MRGLGDEPAVNINFLSLKRDLQRLYSDIFIIL